MWPPIPPVVVVIQLPVAALDPRPRKNRLIRRANQFQHTEVLEGLKNGA